MEFSIIIREIGDKKGASHYYRVEAGSRDEALDLISMSRRYPDRWFGVSHMTTYEGRRENACTPHCQMHEPFLQT